MRRKAPKRRHSDDSAEGSGGERSGPLGVPISAIDPSSAIDSAYPSSKSRAMSFARGFGKPKKKKAKTEKTMEVEEVKWEEDPDFKIHYQRSAIQLVNNM